MYQKNAEHVQWQLKIECEIGRENENALMSGTRRHCSDSCFFSKNYASLCKNTKIYYCIIFTGAAKAEKILMRMRNELNP